MLYTKPIKDITWEDIDEFCKQKIPEGAYLDYKKDFPSSLEKTIAAMANTFGGIIIIGVEEDDENKAKLPLIGIKHERGLEERVINIILSNITPPIIPDITVCKNLDGKKAIIVIRIPQSHQTPHAIKNNTKVYIRVGNQNKPEELLVSVDKLEWLKDGRQKSVNFRESLYENANNRFKNICIRKSRTEFKMTPKSMEDAIQKVVLTLSFCPYYPKESFNNPPEMTNMGKEIDVKSYDGNATFPYPFNVSAEIVQDGVVKTRIDGEGGDINAEHTELNIFGLYLYKENLLRKADSDGKRKAVYEHEIIELLDLFLDSSVKLYNKLEYPGMLYFKVRFENILDCELVPFTNPTDNPALASDEKTSFSYDVLASALESKKNEILLQTYQQIGWTFGLSFNQETLDNCLKGCKPGYSKT